MDLRISEKPHKIKFCIYSNKLWPMQKDYMCSYPVVKNYGIWSVQRSVKLKKEWFWRKPEAGWHHTVEIDATPCRVGHFEKMWSGELLYIITIVTVTTCNGYDRKYYTVRNVSVELYEHRSKKESWLSSSFASFLDTKTSIPNRVVVRKLSQRSALRSAEPPLMHEGICTHGRDGGDESSPQKIPNFSR